MKKTLRYGMIFVLFLNFFTLIETDECSNVEFTLNIEEWIVNPIPYTGTVEIAYTGDEATSLTLNKLEMYESGNLLWETDVLEELKGAGENYSTYKQAVDTYSSALQSGDQKALEEAYAAIERLTPLISESVYEIKVPIDPNKIFSENEFVPGNKKEITFTLKFSYLNEIYEISKETTIEIRQHLPLPPFPQGQYPPAGWFLGDLHVHSDYTSSSCDLAAYGDQTIAERRARAQNIGMSWLSITDHSYCFESPLDWNNMLQECMNSTDSTFVVFPGEELSVGEDCPDGVDSETLCQASPGSCVGFAAHLGAQSLTRFIQNIWGNCPTGTSGRCPAYPGSQQGIDLANSQGFSVINHPIALQWDWESMGCVRGETGIEIWNGEWDNYDQNTLNLWTNLLLNGRKIYAYGGGDIENTGPPLYGPDLGVLYNGVFAASLTQNGLRDALKKGNLYITNYPGLSIEGHSATSGWKLMGRELIVLPGQQATIRVSYNTGSQSATLIVYQGVIGNSAESQTSYSVTGSGFKEMYVSPPPDTYLYYRAYIITANNTRAFTNPIWTRVPPRFGEMPTLFGGNSFHVVGDDAYCTDVLGTANLSWIFGEKSMQRPEGRTDTILKDAEHQTGNLLITGGPAINSLAVEFDEYFGITYEYVENVTFTIISEDHSITLPLSQYPHRDIAIVYLGKHRGRSILLAWGYGWQGTYAATMLMSHPNLWPSYTAEHLLFIEWNDSDYNGLVTFNEIVVVYPYSAYLSPPTPGTWYLDSPVFQNIPRLFGGNTIHVAGNDAYCTDVLGTANVSWVFGARTEYMQRPEGRTNLILPLAEHQMGNLLITGGPAINPLAVEFDGYFGISYLDNTGLPVNPYFEITSDGNTLRLYTQNYPNKDICIIHLGRQGNRNVLLIWGYGWQGTYAGTLVVANSSFWETGVHMMLLEWNDYNNDDLIQFSEITVIYRAYGPHITAEIA